MSHDARRSRAQQTHPEFSETASCQPNSVLSLSRPGSFVNKGSKFQMAATWDGRAGTQKDPEVWGPRVEITTNPR